MYTLRNAANVPVRSSSPGQLGGNSKLKIFGKLDCPSALRHLARGHYTAVRVFFKDETVARAAGYRPCGICMPIAYTQWKASLNK